MYAQNNIFPPTGFAGIGTQNLFTREKPLHIIGMNTGYITDPVARFGFGEEQAGETIYGHIGLLITPYNTFDYYTQLLHLRDSSLFISSSEKAKNLILTTRNGSGRIALATSPADGAPDIARLQIFPDGKMGYGLQYWGGIDPTPVHKVDFNIGNWNWNLGKISLAADGAHPSIRFYRPTGDEPQNPNGRSYSWWLEVKDLVYLEDMSDSAVNGSLLFRVGRKSGEPTVYSEIIGNEVPKTRMLINSSGNVGINNDAPHSRLSVKRGNVVFWGDDVESPSTDFLPAGAGNRFMWVPDKAAIRAGSVGEVVSSWWNKAYIGDYSVAFGRDCQAESEGTVAIGGSVRAYGINSIAIGFWSAAGSETLYSGGPYNSAYAFGSTVWASNHGALAIGHSLRAAGYRSVAFANNVETNKRGSLIAGDINNEFDGKYFNVLSEHNNINQVTLKFTGDATKSEAEPNPVFIFVTESNKDHELKNGMFLVRGGNGTLWASDINLKKNIQSVDEYNILAKLRQVPIKTWQWCNDSVYADTVVIWDTVSYRWLGPMAQDFYQQFPIGYPDSTLLSESVMSATMFASIQALANITDTLKATIQQQEAKSDKMAEKADSALTKEEFEKFKDTLKCYVDVCERLDSLENKSEQMITLTEFISFKDSITCLADACDKIKLLENDNEEMKAIISDLKSRIAVLESKDSSIVKGGKSDEIQGSILQKSNTFEDIILEQNNPNPFAETTEINYYIPSKYKGVAKLIITDENGIQILQEHIACIGKPCQLKVSAKELKTGAYIYGILLNGRIIKSQKMLIIK